MEKGMRERLTERDEFGNADIIGVDSMDLQANLEFDELNLVTEALNRLAYYEEKQEQGLLIEKPCNRGDKIFCIIGSRFGKERRVEERTVRGARLLDYEKQPNSWTVSVYPTQGNDANLQFVWGRGAFPTRAEAVAAMKEEKG